MFIIRAELLVHFRGSLCTWIQKRTVFFLLNMVRSNLLNCLHAFDKRLIRCWHWLMSHGREYDMRLSFCHVIIMVQWKNIIKDIGTMYDKYVLCKQCVSFHCGAIELLLCR